MTIALVPAIACLLLQAQEAPSARARGLEEVANKVRTVLKAIREDEPVSAEILTKRLVQIGAASTPTLLEALETGVIPGTKEPMDSAREAAAVAALSGRTRGELAAQAIALLDRSKSVHTTAIVVNLLGAVGDRRELPLICRVVRPASDEIVDGELTDAFETAAASILRRDASAASTCHALLREQPDPVRWSLVRALAKSGTESALVALAGELGVNPEDDLFVLEQMARASASMPSASPESIQVAVRTLLRSEKPALVAKAATCLAAMNDTEAVEEMIELLRHGDPAVRREVHAALCSAANVRLLPDAERWSHWLEGETSWMREEYPKLVEDLRGGTPVAAVQAISAMAAHPLHRRAIAEVLTSGIEHEPASIRRMACSALRQLGARSAVPYLERWAEDTDPELAVEARRTLAILRPGGGPQAAGGSRR